MSVTHYFEIFKRWVGTRKEDTQILKSISHFTHGDSRRYVGDMNPSDFYEGIKELREMMIEDNMNSIEVIRICRSLMVILFPSTYRLGNKSKVPHGKFSKKKTKNDPNCCRITWNNLFKFLIPYSTKIVEIFETINFTDNIQDHFETSSEYSGDSCTDGDSSDEEFNEKDNSVFARRMNSLVKLTPEDKTFGSRQKRKTTKDIDYSQCTAGGAGLNRNNIYSDFTIREVFIRMINEVSSEIEKSSCASSSISSGASSSRSSGASSSRSSGASSSGIDSSCSEPAKKKYKR